jgi:hypothetical protein
VETILFPLYATKKSMLVIGVRKIIAINHRIVERKPIIAIVIIAIN